MNESHADHRPKVGRWKRGWLTVKAAWKVFKLDKELSVFAFLGGLFALVIAGVGFGISIWVAPGHTFDSQHLGHAPATIAVWIATAILLSCVATYSAAAIIGGALMRFRGQNPTVKDGFRAVKRRWGSLTLFAIMNAGIGQALKAVEDRLPWLGGRIVAYIVDVAWAVASLMAIPVIVDSKEPVTPVKAVKQSVGIIKKAWGEVAVSNLGIGFIFLILVVLELVGGTIITIASASVTGIATLPAITGLLTFFALVATLI